jgi:hypothetical protein
MFTYLTNLEYDGGAAWICADFDGQRSGAGCELAGEPSVDLGESDEAGHFAGEEDFGCLAVHLNGGWLGEERMRTWGGLTGGGY